jgi:hypothetical protein
MAKKAQTKKSDVQASEVQFKVLTSDSKRGASKPSIKYQIDGLPESTVLWSRRIEHPNGDKYDNPDKASYGKVKTVTQYSRNADFTDLIDWEADVPSTSVYVHVDAKDSKGQTYKKAVKRQVRYPGLIPTPAQKAILKNQATLTAMSSISYKTLDVFEALDKLIAGTQHKPTIEAVNQMSSFISSGITDRLTLLMNKANGVKSTSDDKLFDYGA